MGVPQLIAWAAWGPDVTGRRLRPATNQCESTAPSKKLPLGSSPTGNLITRSDPPRLRVTGTLGMPSLCTRRLHTAMTRSLTKWVLSFLTLLLAFTVAIGGFTVFKAQGWLSPLGIESASQDSQVIHAIERTQEVSLLSLFVQGIKQKNRSATVFGKSVPGTGEKVFLQYDFQAKLGIDGAKVKVAKTGASTYLISVPKFTFIGYDKPTFKVAAADGCVLGWATPDIDQVEMVNEILNDNARQTYILSNEDLLKEQTEAFYDSLINSIDPAATTTFEFSS